MLAGILYQFINSFAFLVLAAVGLSVIFGVMNVINFAHGAFIMLGAVTTAALVNRYGLTFWIAVPIVTVALGVFGMLIERLVVRRLYERVVDALLATWAINLLLTQGVLILLGPLQKGIQTPFAHFRVGDLSYSTYSVFVAVVAGLVLVFLYWLFMHTDFGMRARAAVEKRDIAEALGTNTTAVHSVTFGIGAAFAGFTGAIYAPQMAISPYFGNQFLISAFTVVIVGGANPLLGTLLSASALSLVSGVLNWFGGSFIGTMGLLVVTMLIIRLLPRGFTGLVARLTGRKR